MREPSHHDKVATREGRARASKAMLDERRWKIARMLNLHDAAAVYDGMSDIEAVLTSDQIVEVDAHLPAPEAAPISIVVVEM